MKPLSRAFARLVLLFFALGIFFLAVNELIPYRTLGDRYRVMDTASETSAAHTAAVGMPCHGGGRGKSTSVTGAAGKLSLMTRRTQPKNAKGSRAP